MTLLLALAMSGVTQCRIVSWEAALVEAKRDGKHIVCWVNCDPPDELDELLDTCVLATKQDSGKPRVIVWLWHGGKHWDRGDYSPGPKQGQIKWYLGQWSKEQASAVWPSPGPAYRSAAPSSRSC